MLRIKHPVGVKQKTLGYPRYPTNTPGGGGGCFRGVPPGGETTGVYSRHTPPAPQYGYFKLYITNNLKKNQKSNEYWLI